MLAIRPTRIFIDEFLVFMEKLLLSEETPLVSAKCLSIVLESYPVRALPAWLENLPLLPRELQ